ncbi:10240_t:CDS:2, partial [Dentiscutata heterogama]
MDIEELKLQMGLVQDKRERLELLLSRYLGDAIIAANEDQTVQPSQNNQVQSSQSNQVENKDILEDILNYDSFPEDIAIEILRKLQDYSQDWNMQWLDYEDEPKNSVVIKNMQ